MKFKLANDIIPDPLKENLLKIRGVEDIDAFFTPDKTKISSPYKLKNIDRAYDALKQHTEESVLTVVDSDLDGYCSSGLLRNYLMKVFPNMEVDYYIHENKQHGLEDVERDIDLNFYNLVFVPDAGTNDRAICEKYPNTTFIVLDHHQQTEEPSDNMIVVNNQISPEYENKSLSGAGVTWQFCRYIDAELGLSLSNDYYDLVAMSLVSDLMDLSVLENRMICLIGFSNIKSPAFHALADKASFKLKGEITPMGVAFYIAPMPNAMCRVGNMDEKERMFLAFSEDDHYVTSNGRNMKGMRVDVATEMARECTNARARQSRQRDKFAELCDIKIQKEGLLDNAVLVIELDEAFDGINKELNGLAAQEVSKRYDRPVLVGRFNEEGELKGSVRAPENMPVPSFREFLIKSGYFEYAEGHDQAFGFSIKESMLPRFIEWSNDKLASDIVDDKSYEVDFLFEKLVSGETKKTIEVIYELRDVWGKGIPKPTLGFKNLACYGSNVSVLGKKADTVKILLNNVEFMFFNQTEEQVEEFIKADSFSIDIYGESEMNFFNGSVTPQVLVREYKIYDNDKYGF